MEVVGPLRTSRPRIAIDPPSFRGLGGFCCLPDRLVSCRRLLGPKIEKRHLRLAARSGGVGNTPTTGSVPRCASLKLFWMSSKVPAPGRAAGGGGARLLNAPPIAAAPTVGGAQNSEEFDAMGESRGLVLHRLAVVVNPDARHHPTRSTSTGDERVPLLWQQSRFEDQALQPPARVLRLRRRRGCREPGRRHLAVPRHVESTPESARAAHVAGWPRLAGARVARGVL